MSNLPATVRVTYNGKNITADISKYLLSCTYTDKTEGEADTLDITLEDTDLLWQNQWYPDKGARLTAEIVQGVNVLKCGTFSIDEINISGSKADGDAVSIKAIAAGFTKRTRTATSRANESKTLRQLALTIAADNGLTVQGKVPDITIERVTQNQQHDLTFLKQEAGKYGIVFSLRENVITFTSIYDLESTKEVLTFDKSDLIGYNITDKSMGTAKAATVKSHNPLKKELVSGSYSGTLETDNSPAADTKVIIVKAETTQQAQAMAKAILYRANSKQQGGTIDFIGDTLAVAGVNCVLQGLGQLSGKYHITASTHTVTKQGGYQGSAEVKRVGLIAAERRKSAVGKKKTTDVSTRYGYGAPEVTPK